MNVVVLPNERALESALALEHHGFVVDLATGKAHSADDTRMATVQWQYRIESHDGPTDPSGGSAA